MSVTIKRKTGLLGVASKMSIKVNGEKVTKIANEEVVDIEIDAESTLLRVTQFGTRSNQIEVKDGDVVEINTTKIYYIIFLFPFISLIVSNSLQDQPYTLNTFLMLFLGMLLILFLFEGYHLKKIDNKSSEKTIPQS
ncbi:hypothetical protein QNK01_09560 [Desemzia incerta]|uniref:hypothetical protein n=1 Tax=Desemzia incerta TaxID=82801 RepID=UPI0024C46986|nr:hypothetical protein [Desemzia incerta]WHZ31716.1 hypothetical protein QNK01_09560 [Desemzia incerta]